VIEECSAVAAHAGFPLSESTSQSTKSRLLDKNSNWSASMARDIEQKMPKIESEDIVGDMIKRAHRSNINVPLLRIAYTHLQVYQFQRGLISNNR
jgi:2-dehydropantoate 2-reductase